MRAASFQVLLERTGCCYAATGVARYIDSLQQALLAAGREVRSFQPAPDGAFLSRRLGQRLRALLYEWHGAAHPPGLGPPGAALVHFTAAPLRYPAHTCCVTTVHDLNVFHARADFAPYSRRVAERRFAALQRADAVITVSDFVRDDLLAAFPALADRTVTVHHGCTFAPPAGAPADKDESLFLYVGGIGPNKNLLRALEAFAQCRAATTLPCRFWIVGPLINAAYDAELRASVRAQGLADVVTLHGEQPDPFVAAAFRRAAYFVFPSLREGFGLPLVEAQANGCACVASRTTCLPEIGGDGAWYVDPASTGDLAAALLALRTNPAQAADLAARGRRNAARFTWARCADATWQVYEQAWRRGGRRT